MYRQNKVSYHSSSFSFCSEIGRRRRVQNPDDLSIFWSHHSRKSIKISAIFAGGFLETQKQGCESRRQTFSSITGPTFRDFGKVPALPRSVTLLGKKVPPGSGPLFGFSRPNPAGNEIPIETEILNSPPPPPNS
jgi:hypothetical protein